MGGPGGKEAAPPVGGHGEILDPPSVAPVDNPVDTLHKTADSPTADTDDKERPSAAASNRPSAGAGEEGGARSGPTVGGGAVGGAVFPAVNGAIALRPFRRPPLPCVI